MTKQILERIKQDNTNVYFNIKSLKEWYSKNTENRNVVMAEIRGYLTGLRQLNFITETEKRILLCYITL